MSEITVGYVGNPDTLQGRVRSELEARPWWSHVGELPSSIAVNTYNRPGDLIEVGSLVLINPRVERVDMHSDYSRVVYDVIEGVGALYAKNILHGNLGLLRVEQRYGKVKATVRLM